MAPERRYVVTEETAGFRITSRRHPLDTPDSPEWLRELVNEYDASRRSPVAVRLTGYAFQIQSACACGIMSLVDYYELLELVSKSLMHKWEPRPSEHYEERGDPTIGRDRTLKNWAIARTKTALNGRVHEQWRRLLEHVDPTVLSVHKRVFSTCFGYEEPMLMLQPEFYRHRFLVDDVLRFRAAPVAMLLCDRIVDRDGQLDAMQNWRTLFAPNGESYRSLNKTLTDLPGNVPPKLLFRLPDFVLPRPISQRLELIATILANSDRGLRHARIVSYAAAADIAEAVRRVSRHLRRDLSPRRWKDVEIALTFITDYPDRHQGRLLGLTERSIRWHRDCRGEEIERTISSLGHDARTAKPLISLPDTSGVRFLSTVGEICAEAAEMEHCIASYSDDAVRGQCYLFHIDYEGERASVEVTPSGRVRQAFGPRNSSNRATDWGRKVLGAWGRKLWQS
jgi:hypothetical protein